MLGINRRNKPSSWMWGKSTRVRMLVLMCLSIWLVVSACSSSAEDKASSAQSENLAKADVVIPQSAAASQGEAELKFDQDVTVVSGTSSKAETKSTADPGVGTEGTTGFSAVNSA